MAKNEKQGEDTTTTTDTPKLPDAAVSQQVTLFIRVATKRGEKKAATVMRDGSVADAIKYVNEAVEKMPDEKKALISRIEIKPASSVGWSALTF